MKIPDAEAGFCWFCLFKFSPPLQKYLLDCVCILQTTEEEGLPQRLKVNQDCIVLFEAGH